MDRDKAIRAAKLTIGGMLEKNRHATAVGRAGGQVAPSKYMPNVPRQVHADGGKVAFQQGNHPLVPDVLYHGSFPKIATKGWTDEVDEEQTQKNRDAQDFRTFKPSEYGNFGPGVYLSDSPKVASNFAQGIRGEQTEALPHGQVMKLHVSMKKPFTDSALRHPAWKDYIKNEIKKALWLNPTNSNNAKESSEQLFQKLDNDTATVRDLFLRDTPDGTMVNQFGQDKIHQTIRNSGFDGIIAHRPDGSKEYVAFKPEQVKSAIGNSGKFDPTNPDITKADGGEVDGITAYHASPEDIVGQFRPSARDVGIHFAANPDLAHNAAVKSLMGRPDMAGKVSPKSFKINARPEQIVDIPAASNRFDFYDILEHLHGTGRIDSDTFNSTFDGLQDIEDKISHPDETMKAQNALFSKAMSKSNIKALRYMNRFDAGPTWRDMEEGRMTSPVTPDHSYIVTDPSAIQHQNITKADGGEVEKKRDFFNDNPGGEWLEGKQARAAQYPDDKFMVGATTGVIGGRSSMFLPTHVLKGIAGLNDEVRTSGVHKYDSLLSDAREGGFDPEQKGNKVVVAVNHYGQPYLLEGNTRVAVAHSMGIPKVKAEVRYWNGAENVDGPMHPEKVFGMASDNPEIAKADGGRVSYGNGGKSLGLYSKAAQIIRNQPQAKGSVDQLLAMVSKTKGVKPIELTNAGRPAGDTMSKEELAKHFEDALPKVDVERIGGRDSNGFPQYEEYTLPGGENYREHLLHLSDEREPPKALHRVMGAFPRDFDSEEGARQYIRQLDTMRNTPGMEGIAESLTRYPAIYQKENGRSTNPNDFKSSHWGTPNVLAHVRMSDRDNGETLHVHEVQSDWGQEGREKGFHDPEKPFEVVNKKTKEVVSRHPDYSSMWDAYRTHPDSDNLTYGDVRDEKPPQGPYVGNTQQWTDLALKHVMLEAAKGGYKRVVFSPGEANADLYGQRKEVSKLEFLKSNDSGEAGILSGFTPNGYYSSQHDVESHADLPKLIGKENAAKLLAQPPTPSPDKGEDRYTHTLQGPLQVGGHGMVDYYKNYVNQGAMKLLQQHDQSAKPESYDLPEGYKGFALPVTDTSRESILKNGFQAFQRGGEVHKATGGQVMGYVPMATLPVGRLALAKAPIQQPQGGVGQFSGSLSSLMDTVKGFKEKPEDVKSQTSSPLQGEAAVPSAATEGHPPQETGGMSEEALAAYGKLQDAYGQPLNVISTYRDPQKNQDVGGAKGSQHLHGNAYDIDVSNMSYEDRLALADLAWNSGFRGIGFYDNSLHFDVGDPRSWGPSHSRDSIPEWAQPFTEERYGYSDGGIAMDDNSQDTSGGNNVESLSLARSLRNIGSGGGDDRVQGLFEKIAAGQQQAQKAYEMAHSNGEFDDFKIGDTFVYKHSKYPTPMKVTGFSVSRAEAFPQRKRIYNNHVPVLEMENQDAEKKVKKYPVEWFQENLHKYDFVSGKPRAVKAGGGAMDDSGQNGAMENGNAPINFETRPQAGGFPNAGGVRGSSGVLQAQDEAPLEGLPTKIGIPLSGQYVTAGPDPRIRQVARDYMASTGMKYNPPTKYAKVDPIRARRIAAAYEGMKDDPNDPLTKASYDAMIKETMAQYNHAKKAGLKVEFWNPENQEDPYGASPRLATEDVRKNHHMWVFPTYAGYGSGDPISEDDAKKNPLLQLTGETWNGIPVTVNDVFRAVHDYYGHAKEGVGFRADGEENAWRSHASMYSPLARMAMTSETRGQNSWLNYGPHGEKNRTARTEDTVFAPQKIGVMPHWVHHEGAEDFTLPEYVETMQRIRSNFDPTVSKALALTRRFTKDGKSAISALKTKGK
jgi:hypothetical protein